MTAEISWALSAVNTLVYLPIGFVASAVCSDCHRANKIFLNWTKASVVYGWILFTVNFLWYLMFNIDFFIEFFEYDEDDSLEPIFAGITVELLL